MTKNIGGLILSLAAVAGIFELTGIGVSRVRLNRELKPLAQEFERVATTQPTYSITVPGKNSNELKLEYKGELTKITEKRDAYLATCGRGIEAGKWRAHPVGYDKTGKLIVSPTTDDSQCIIPYKTFPSYAEFSRKYDIAQLASISSSINQVQKDPGAAASRALDKYQRNKSN